MAQHAIKSIDLHCLEELILLTESTAVFNVTENRNAYP